MSATFPMQSQRQSQIQFVHRRFKRLRLLLCGMVLASLLFTATTPTRITAKMSSDATSVGIGVSSSAKADKTNDKTDKAPAAPLLGPALPVDNPPVIRELPGDLWADKVIGQPAFTQVSPLTTDETRLFWSKGTLVDRAHNRLYVYDAGNNRIVSVNLADPVRCPASGPCTADIVLGQTDMSGASCNRDSSFQDFPYRARASNTTLCLQPENVFSVEEVASGASMAIDTRAGHEGDLYVADFFNNRVLRYAWPITTGAAAAQVWGQADFKGQECNRSAVRFPNPDNTTPGPNTLCFSWGVVPSYLSGNNNVVAGVDIDPAGNLWVVDSGNHRVLMFPNDPTTGFPSYTATVALGQPDLNHRYYDCGATGQAPALNRMCNPSVVRMDWRMPSSTPGWLYVTDQHSSANGYDRVLVFKPQGTPPHFESNQAGELFKPYGVFLRPASLDFEPTRRGVWVSNTGHLDVERWLTDTTDLNPAERIGMYNSCYHICEPEGSVGFDSSGNAYVASATLAKNSVLEVNPSNPNLLVRPIFPSTYHVAPGNTITDREISTASGVVASDDQLIVADGVRLIYWNGLANLTNGQTASGVITNTAPTPAENRFFMKASHNHHLYVTVESPTGNRIDIYDLPIDSKSVPTKSLAFPLTALDGTSIPGPGVFWGVAPTDDDSFLWVTHNLNNDIGNRVFRIRNPLSSDPRVDVVLGQENLTDQKCNRGGSAQLNTLCRPGLLSLDHLGNLYVSDHSLEADGNFRLLEFNKELFPPNNTTIIFGPDASKQFPGIAVWETAFDKQNRMFVGYNHYIDTNHPYPIGWPEDHSKFVGIYNHPLSPTSTDTNLLLSDYHSQSFAATFDDNDNLYVGDLNRASVMIYKQPAYGQPVTWSELFSANATGNRPFNSIEKSGGVPMSWDGSGISTIAIQSGNGYAQTTIDALGQWRMFGLTHNNTTSSYTDINYAMFLKADNYISIYESGQWKADLNVSFTLGDILRIWIENNQVKYYKNGTVIYTSGTSPTYPLRFDTSLASAGSRIGNAYLGGDNLGAVTWDSQSAQNVQIQGNSLRKTGGVHLAWDASAASTQKLWSGNGYAQLTVDEPTTWRMFGLTSSNTNHSYTDIDYCIFIKDDGYLTIYQRGNFVADLNVHVEKGDVLKVMTKSGTVKMYRNQDLICPASNCQFSLPISYPLMVDDSIASLTGLTFNPDWGGRIYNVFLNGDDVH